MRSLILCLCLCVPLSAATITQTHENQYGTWTARIDDQTSRVLNVEARFRPADLGFVGYPSWTIEIIEWPTIFTDPSRDELYFHPDGECIDLDGAFVRCSGLKTPTLQFTNESRQWLARVSQAWVGEVNGLPTLAVTNVSGPGPEDEHFDIYGPLLVRTVPEPVSHLWALLLFLVARRRFRS